MGVRIKILLGLLVAAAAVALFFIAGNKRDSFPTYGPSPRQNEPTNSNPASPDPVSIASEESAAREREPLGEPGPSDLLGLLTSTLGAPIEGANVEIKLARGEPEPLTKTLRKSATDKFGEFSFDALAPGLYMVTASKAGHSKEIAYDIRIPRKEKLRLQMYAPATLAGIVRDRASGKALPNALVVIDYAAPSGKDVQGPELFTDEKGEFRLDALRGDQPSILVQASKDGYARASIREEGPAAGTNKWIDIGLSRGFRIEGLTVDDLDRPLPGARISLIDESVRSHVSEVSSDERGSFSLPEFSPDSIFSLQASKPGYRSAELGALKLPLKIPTLRLERLGAIAGTVRNAAGLPLEQFTIRAFQEATRGYREEETQKSFSNAGGKFLMENIAPGEIDLLIWSEGLAPLKREKIRLGPGERLEGFQIVLERGAIAQGRVMAPNGQAVAGATVYLVEKTRNGLFAGTQGPSYSTDASGAFSLPGIPKGAAVVRVAKRGFAEKLLTFSNPGSEPIDLGAVTLDRGGSVEGLCLGPYGQPLVGFLVEAFPENETLPIQVKSDANGRYRLENLPAGPIDVMGHHPFKLEGISPLHRFHRHLEISGDQVLSADFDYRKGGSLLGKVSAPGGAMPLDLVANLIDSLGNVVEGSTAVDSSGNFEIHSIREGAYELWIRSPSRDFSSSRPVRIREGEAVEIRFLLGEARIAGRVSQTNGQPIAGASLVARRTETDPQGYRASTNEAGEFLLEGIEAGVYRLEFTKNGFGPIVIPKYIAGAGDGPSLQIVLQPSSSLRLVVKSTSGQVLAKTIVRLEKTGDPLFPGAGDAESGTDGSALWSNLTEGDYTARPVSEDLFPSTLQVSLGSGAKASGELIARHRGNLRVVLRHGDKQGLKEIQVSAMLSGAEFQGGTVEWAKQGKIAVNPQDGFTDEDGRIVFLGLPEGNFEVLVLGGVQSKTATVKAGKTVEVFFDL